MAVDRAFRHTGATTGKENRGGFVISCLCCVIFLVCRNLGQNLLEGRTAPEKSSTHSQQYLDGWFPPAKQDTGKMRFRNPNKCFGLCFGKTGFQIFHAHPWINQNRDSAYFEKGKGQSKEFEAGRHHEDGAHAPHDTD